MSTTTNMRRAAAAALATAGIAAAGVIGAGPANAAVINITYGDVNYCKNHVDAVWTTGSTRRWNYINGQKFVVTWDLCVSTPGLSKGMQGPTIPKIEYGQVSVTEPSTTMANVAPMEARDGFWSGMDGSKPVFHYTAHEEILGVDSIFGIDVPTSSDSAEEVRFDAAAGTATMCMETTYWGWWCEDPVSIY